MKGFKTKDILQGKRSGYHIDGSLKKRRHTNLLYMLPTEGKLDGFKNRNMSRESKLHPETLISNKKQPIQATKP